MPRSELHGIKHPDYLVEVAPSRHRIRQRELNALVWTNHKDSPNRCIERRCTAITTITCIGWQHVVEFGDFEFWVSNDWVIHLLSADVLDVLSPFSVALDRIDAETDDFCPAIGKLPFQASDSAKLGGADRCEVFRMRKEDCPVLSKSTRGGERDFLFAANWLSMAAVAAGVSGMGNGLSLPPNLEERGRMDMPSEGALRARSHRRDGLCARPLSLWIASQ